MSTLSLRQQMQRSVDPARHPSDDLDDTDAPEGLPSRLAPAVVPSLLALLLFVAKARGWIGLKGSADSVDLVLVLAIFVPWLIPFVRRVKYGEIEVEAHQRRRAVREVKELVIAAGEAKALVRPGSPHEAVPAESQSPARKRERLAQILSTHERNHLRNLAVSPSPSYQDFHESLRHELERLLAFGYIQRIPGKGIRTFFRMKGRIGDHFELTPDGHAALAVLEGREPPYAGDRSDGS